MERKAEVVRNTTETRIRLVLSLDGTGEARVETGLPFFDHMLQALARHGFLNLDLSAQGDLEVDAHHLMEDVGIVFGQALRQAVGDRAGLNRFGAAMIPMDDALARVVLDLSGRPCLCYDLGNLELLQVGNLSLRLFREFFYGLVNLAGMNLHIALLAGTEPHHSIEAVFKAFGRALDSAVGFDERLQGVPSTKGTLD